MLFSVQKCDFAIGNVIDHQYTVEEVLGKGVFGKVFLIKDFAGQTYALKLMRLWEIPQDVRQQLIARFDMEYETGQISSHYLVQTVNHGLVKGNPYIVMEYLANRDLKKWMRRTQPDLIKIGKETLYGLMDLHSSGKVHRDLKPSNVLIREDGSVALTDFGIAGDRNKRLTARNTKGIPQQMIGSYPYMPPEQLEPKEEATVLPTTDIFSFGVMMFELLTGQLPFGAIEKWDDLETYKKNVFEGQWDRTRLSISEFAPVIEGCLKPDYKERLQSVADVLMLMPHSDREIPYIAAHPPVQTSAKKGFQLRIIQGEEQGKVYQLDAILRDGRRLITVGRHDANNHNTLPIVENHSAFISRRHCTLEKDLDTGEWYIRDGQWSGEKEDANNWKRSENGTFVNRIEVDSEGMVIKGGDVISIGETLLRMENAEWRMENAEWRMNNEQ